MTRYVDAPDGVKIAYETEGAGPPVVLVHGFGSSRAVNWKNTHWLQTLARAGRQAVALDCRGHGESDKPHAAARYDEGIMAADIGCVMDDLGIASADIMGYSMGGFLAIRLMHDAAKRARRVVLAGLGANYFHTTEAWAKMIAQALTTPDPATIADPQGKEFRVFGEKAGNDLEALAACVLRPRHTFMPDELQLLTHKILVVCGEQDTLTGSPEPLAQAFSDAKSVIVPRRNHHSTVGDRVYKDAVLEFLSG